MANLQKKSIHFPEHSIQDLLGISSGLSTLLGVYVSTDEYAYFVSGADKDNISRIATLQEDIVKEVSSRIPLEFLEKIPNEEGGSDEKS